jgi:hypothetical protein
MGAWPQAESLPVGNNHAYINPRIGKAMALPLCVFELSVASTLLLPAFKA